MFTSYGMLCCMVNNNDDEMNRPGSMCINGHLDPSRHLVSRTCKACQRERAKERRRQDGAARVKAYRARAREQGIAAYGGACYSCGTRDTEVLQLVLLDPSVTLHTMIWVAARQMQYPDIFALVCPTCRYRAKYMPGELTPGQTS